MCRYLSVIDKRHPGKIKGNLTDIQCLLWSYTEMVCASKRIRQNDVQGANCITTAPW